MRQALLIATFIFIGGIVGTEPALGLAFSGETRTGQTPINFQSPGSFASELELIPAGIVFFPGKKLELGARYFPRLLFRVPDVGFSRPLLLHQGELRLRSQLNQRVSTQFLGRIGFGDSDYTGLVRFFRTSQPGDVPSSAVLRYLDASFANDWNLRLSRRWATTFFVGSQHLRPASDDSIGFIAFDRLDVRPRLNYRVSRRALLAAEFAHSEYFIDADIDRAHVDSASFIYGHSFTPRTRAEVSLGAAMAYGNNLQSQSFFSGRLDFLSRVYTSRNLSLDWSSVFFLAPQISILSGLLIPRATFQNDWIFHFRNRWSMSIQGVFSTEATSDPNPLTSQGATVFQFNIPVRHETETGDVYGFGLRSSIRATHLNEKVFEVGGESVLLYASVLWGFTTNGRVSADRSLDPNVSARLIRERQEAQIQEEATQREEEERKKLVQEETANETVRQAWTRRIQEENERERMREIEEERSSSEDDVDL